MSIHTASGNGVVLIHEETFKVTINDLSEELTEELKENKFAPSMGLTMSVTFQSADKTGWFFLLKFTVPIRKRNELLTFLAEFFTARDVPCSMRT